MDEAYRFSSPRMMHQLAAGRGTAFELRRGERLQITDHNGKQVCTLIAFVRDDHSEYLSPAQTRIKQGSIMLSPGSDLVSNRRAPLLTLEQDTVGRHDLLYPACDAAYYRETYGFSDHANCADNLAQALEEFGIVDTPLPDPVNFFMHVTVLRRGQLEIREPLSVAGDAVVLLARTDLIVALSACPQDQNPSNAYNPTDLLLRIAAADYVAPEPAPVEPEESAAATATATAIDTTEESPAEPASSATEGSEPVATADTESPDAGELASGAATVPLTTAVAESVAPLDTAPPHPGVAEPGTGELTPATTTQTLGTAPAGRGSDTPHTGDGKPVA